MRFLTLIPLLACAQACPAQQPAVQQPPPVIDDDADIARPPPSPPPPRELATDLGDLDAIKKRGSLRVLVFGHGEDVLPRAGASMSENESTAVALAEHLGVRPELISVDHFNDLIPLLLQGKGDLIAARMSVTDARKKLVAFTRATAVVDEVLVAQVGDANAPKTLAELAGKTVTIRASSAYRETLDALGEKEAKGVVVTSAAEDRDTERLVFDVGQGKLPYTVCDSDWFSQILAYNNLVKSPLVLRNNREIAFAVRPGNGKLKTAADAWLIERTLSAHAKEAEKLDLDAILKRGSIRMLTRNNAVSYFLYKGTQQGFDYEWVKLFAKENGLRLDVVVPPESKDLIPWLNEGRGDVIAAEMTVNSARAADVWFSSPYNFVDEVIVQRAGEAPLTSVSQLKGKTIHVRPSSSYRRTLDALQPSAGPFTLVDAAEDDETEALIAQVAAGTIPLTVADSTIAAVEKSWRDDIQTSLPLASSEIALAARKDSPKLQRALDAFVRKHVTRGEGRIKGSVEYNLLKHQYFESTHRANEAQEDFKETGQISRYDNLIRNQSTNYGLDWRLMAAQAYQESRFNPEAKSWVGALGLFQVMPRTGAEMGFVDLKDPETGIGAGVSYMAQMIESFDKDIPFKHRVRFALASYNAGRGHVEDARRLAAELGLNPNKWFKNVEVAMLKLQDQRVAKKMKHGYCRGEEPVKYVSEIQSRYDNYITIVPDPGLDAAAKKGP